MSKIENEISFDQLQRGWRQKSFGNYSGEEMYVIIQKYLREKPEEFQKFLKGKK